MKRPWYMRPRPAVVLVAGLGGLFTLVDLACAQPWAATTAPPLPMAGKPSPLQRMARNWWQQESRRGTSPIFLLQFTFPPMPARPGH